MAEENKAKKVILVVDDDPMLLTLYKKLFSNKGMEVLLAQDGQEGLEMIQQEKPDFVILDIRMPKLDGLSALKIMKANDELKDVPVMVLTNYGNEEYRETAQKLGVVDFLVKTNIDPSGLVKRVSDYLQNR